MTDKNLRQQLRDKRVRLLIGSKTVAKVLNVAQSSLSAWERGETNLMAIPNFYDLYRQFLRDCEDGKIKYVKNFRVGQGLKLYHRDDSSLCTSQLTLPLHHDDEKNDKAIHHPPHYSGKIEVIDFIDAHNLNFNLGNVVKYVSRSGRKDGEDTLTALKKALWYLSREIQRHEQVQQAVQQQD